MLNKTELIGRLGKDPEYRKLDSGKFEVANFSLATWERYKDASGEYKEITEWHNCVIWGPQAGTAAKHLHKGDMIYFEGKSQTRKWEDRDGNTKYTTEVNGNFLFLPKAKKDGSGAAKTEARKEGDDLPF